MKTIIFDMDGTIANIDIRRKYIAGEKKDWVSFNDKFETDTENTDICDLARMYSTKYTLLIFSGRFESSRKATELQLRNWNIPYYILLLRKNGDYRKDIEVKYDMLMKINDVGYYPQIAVDDRNSVVRMWRDNGLRCLQVADGDF